MKKIFTVIIALMIMIVSSVNVFAEQVYLADQGLVINPDDNLKWYTRQAEISEDDIKYVGGSEDTFKNDMIKKDEYLKLCDASSTYIIHVRIFDTEDADYTNTMEDKMISDIEEDKVCGHFNTVGVKLSDVGTVSINFNKYGCAKYKDEDSGKVGYFVTMIRNKKMYCFVFDSLNRDSIGETEMNILHKLVESVIYKVPNSSAEVNPESQHVQSSNTIRNTGNDGTFMETLVFVLKIIVLVVVIIALILIFFKSYTDKKKLKKKIEFNSRRNVNDIDRLNRIMKDDFVEPEHIDKEAEEEKKWLGEDADGSTDENAAEGANDTSAQSAVAQAASTAAQGIGVGAQAVAHVADQGIGAVADAVGEDETSSGSTTENKHDSFLAD